MMCWQPWNELRTAVLILVLAGVASVSRASISREQIEADWQLQDRLRVTDSSVTREQDAAGACDGVKDGQWGFHTEHEDRPWWQVDLGKPHELDRLLVYNRTDFARESRPPDRAGFERRQGLPAGLSARRHDVPRPCRRQAARDSRSRASRPVSFGSNCPAGTTSTSTRSRSIRPATTRISPWASPAHKARSASGRESTVRLIPPCPLTWSWQRGMKLAHRLREMGVDVVRRRRGPRTARTKPRTSRRDGPFARWPWRIRSWTSTAFSSSSGPPARCRTSPTSTTAGGPGPAAASTSSTVSKGRRPACDASRRDGPKAVSFAPTCPTTASGCSSPTAATIPTSRTWRRWTRRSCPRTPSIRSTR